MKISILKDCLACRLAAVNLLLEHRLWSTESKSWLVIPSNVVLYSLFRVVDFWHKGVFSVCTSECLSRFNFMNICEYVHQYEPTFFPPSVSPAERYYLLFLSTIGRRMNLDYQRPINLNCGSAGSPWEFISRFLFFHKTVLHNLIIPVVFEWRTIPH